MTALNPSDLEVATGEIHWPAALQRRRFAEHRKAIDELFAVRIHTGTSPDLVRSIFKASRDMHKELKKEIRTLPYEEYAEARKFLDQLVEESRYSPG